MQRGRYAADHTGVEPISLARPGRRLLAALLLAVLAALSGAGGANAAPRMEVAVQDDPLFFDPVTLDQGLALAAGVHATTVRFNVLWARLNAAQASQTREPRAVAYDFTALDSAIAAAAAHGMRVQLTLTGPAPAWATADHRIGVKGPDPDRFAAFARRVAAHYRGRIVRYTIWNEPNLIAWLRGTRGRSSAETYRRLFIAGSAAVRASDPRADVLIGETAAAILPGGAHGTQPLRFLRAVACVNRAYRRVGHCAALRADGYAHHPYEFTDDPHRRTGVPADAATIGTLDHLTRALDRLRAARALMTPGGRPLDVYLTEFGYFAQGTRTLPPARRGAYLREAFEIARRNPRVRQMLQYELMHKPWARWDTGLVGRDGVPDPAYTALADWAASRDRIGLLAR